MNLCSSRKLEDTISLKKFIYQHINDIALPFKEVPCLSTIIHFSHVSESLTKSVIWAVMKILVNRYQSRKCRDTFIAVPTSANDCHGIAKLSIIIHSLSDYMHFDEVALPILNKISLIE